MNTDKTQDTGNANGRKIPLQRHVIREALEEDIASRIKLARKYENSGQKECACRENQIRQGVVWALFILATKFDV